MLYEVRRVSHQRHNYFPNEFRTATQGAVKLENEINQRFTAIFSLYLVLV